jgi:LacI family transcriptional regulator
MATKPCHSATRESAYTKRDESAHIVVVRAVVNSVSNRDGVTIYQVAARAGVSITTVSRVLRGSGPVASDTRDRVMAAVEDLRFTPSALGRGLAERKHAANGIVFPDLSGPYYAEVVLGYEEVAGELGRSVVILSTHGRRAVRSKVLDLASRVDGLVVFGRTVPDDVIGEIVGTGTPVVLLARPPIAECDSITTENVQSARLLTSHLLDHGHRRVVFLGDPTSSSDAAQRWEGVSAELKARGVRSRRPVYCDLDEKSGYRVARRVLSAGNRPDALICPNDEIALGSMLAAEELGLRVPDDVAVTGWDDIMAARHCRPALTTVRQPMRDLGGWAARVLDERIAGVRTAPEQKVLATELVIRSSCGSHGDQPDETDVVARLAGDRPARAFRHQPARTSRPPIGAGALGATPPVGEITAASVGSTEAAGTEDTNDNDETGTNGAGDDDGGSGPSADADQTGSHSEEER